MDTVSKEHKRCVIMGDMNIDLLKFETHLKTSDYLNNLFQNDFLPTITKSTRITNIPATLIYHIYMNNDLADHFGTFYISKARKTKHLPNSSMLKNIWSTRTSQMSLPRYAQMKHMVSSLNCTKTHLKLFAYVKLIIKYGEQCLTTGILISC